MKIGTTSSILTSIDLISFLGGFGLALLLPIFPDLLFNTAYHPFPFPFFSPFRPLFFAFLLTMFPLFQWISRPFYLFWKRKYQLKNIFLWSSFFLGISFWCSGYFISQKNFLLLLIAQSVSGFLGGSFFSLFPSKDRPNKILPDSHVMKILLLGWIGGLTTGALFSNQDLFPNNSLATPFWIAGFIALFSFAFILFTLPKEGEFHLFKKNLEEGKGQDWRGTLLYLPLLFTQISLTLFSPIYFFTFFEKAPLLSPIFFVLLSLVYILGHFWIAPLLSFYKKSDLAFLILFCGAILSTLPLLLYPKNLPLSILLHLLSILSISTLLGMLPHFFPLSIPFNWVIFSITPIVSSLFFVINIQLVYSIISLIIISTSIIHLKFRSSLIRKI